MPPLPQPQLVALACAAFCVAAPSAWATSHLSGQLPSTPQSCNTCHESGPGSARNAFGLQVEAHLTGDGSTGTLDWPALCALDADADGSSNGAELGDPCCTFVAGDTVGLPTSDPNNASSTSTNSCADGGVVIDVDAGPTAPTGWTCAAALHGNGECDCGCGVVDEDCADASHASCAFNACSEGVVDVVDPTSCVASEADSAWTCGFQAYGDGDVCDCGCGVVDPDCPNAAATSCAASGCRPGFDVDANDPTACVASEALQGGRPGWWCPTAWYATDDGCDCGCGLVDPDCPRATQVTDCSQQGCAFSALGDDAIVDGRDVAQCILPDAAPAGWTCDAAFYDAGDGCDCGCGVVDPDCADDSFAYCEHSGCPDGQVVDEGDATACVAPSTLGCAATPTTSLGLAWAVGVVVMGRRRRRRANTLDSNEEVL